MHKLRARTLEHIPSILTLEQLLRSKRGYVFRMPKPGSPVILLLSGGLDSVTCWGILMEEFGLAVYPLSLDRGERRRNKEEASVHYFSNLYRTRYPTLHHDPFYTDAGGRSLRIPIEHAPRVFHPDVLLQELDKYGFLKTNLSLGVYMTLPVYAKMFAEYLYLTQNISTHTIFCSVTLSDGTLVPHQTFTAIRSIMAYLCITTGDFSWQYASPVFEKELGLYLDKSDLIRWAHSHDIPLERTWSCYRNGKYQCGQDCVACHARRAQFKIAGIRDRTMYRSLEEQSLRGRCVHFLKTVLSKPLIQALKHARDDLC